MNESLKDLDEKIFRISWQNIDSGARAIVSNIQREHDDVKAVVCWQHDAIAAAIVSRILDIPMGIVHAQEKINGMKVDCYPTFTSPIRSGEYNQPQPKIAIVTTMVDDEHNVDTLSAIYNANNPIVTSVYSRKDIECPPDYHWSLIARGVECIYPWEEEVT